MIYEAHIKRETLFAKVMHNALLNLKFEIELYDIIVILSATFRGLKSGRSSPMGILALKLV